MPTPEEREQAPERNKEDWLLAPGFKEFVGRDLKQTSLAMR